jgi:uncharacterized protein (TIGR02391 family)
MYLEPFTDVQLMEICKVLGDTYSGLTGREIGSLLESLGIDDPSPTMTKRDRLFHALRARQQRDKSGNIVARFIMEAMAPIRYVPDKEDVFRERQERLNSVLSFVGLALRNDGKLVRISQTRTISEAQQRAQNLRRKLINRGAHADVLRYCNEELLKDNYFHAVFEATKSVAQKIRDKTGLSDDGAELVNKAFCGSTPLLALNKLQSKTERSEQKGFANLLKGLFGTFRNTTAHAPKITWPINEQDALDILTFISYVHRRLDNCVRTPYHR